MADWFRMREEREVRERLKEITAEYDSLIERFLYADQEWTRSAYSHAILDVAARQAALRWVLGKP